MSDTFPYDVLLSQSSKDEAGVRPLAERLRADGLNIWFDEWEVKPGDSIPAKIEEGLEHSRVLLFCMSAQAFGSDWAQLESGTFRFRDPLNKERRFIPLRLDNAQIRGSLAQFLYVDWRERAERDYVKLFESCRPERTQFTEEKKGPRSDGQIRSGLWATRTASGPWRGVQTGGELSPERQHGADLGREIGPLPTRAGRPHQHRQ